MTHFDINRILERRPDLKPLDFVECLPSEEKDDLETFISTYGKKQIVLKKKLKSQDCMFLENNRCTIHDFKPRACKVWPFGLEKGNISWIKEHKGFIKKYCKHTSSEGANDPEELKPLIKQHYKERKIFSKLVQKWNDEKKKELNGDDIFSSILDEDFINFILKEIHILKQVEAETNNEEELLGTILTSLINDRRIESITENGLKNIYSFDRHPYISFNLFIQENNIDSFFNNENIKKLQENIKADSIKISNNMYQMKTCTCFINGKFLHLNVFPFYDLKKPMPFDTRVLYNPYALDINIMTFEENKKSSLEEIFENFWFKVLQSAYYIKDNNFLDSKLLLNSALHFEVCGLIYWLNQKNFTLLDIPFLNKKSDDFKVFLTKFSEFKTDMEGQLSFLKEITDIFKQNWDLAEFKPENKSIEKIISDYENMVNSFD